jgi:hypothetical protein
MLTGWIHACTRCDDYASGVTGMGDYLWEAILNAMKCGIPSREGEIFGYPVVYVDELSPYVPDPDDDDEEEEEFHGEGCA